MLEEEVHDTSSEASEVFTNQPNAFVRGVRSIFGYRKTSLTLFVILTIVVTAGLSFYDNSLELTIELPTSQLEKEILESSWLDLQNIARYPHTYGSRANDQVHDYLEEIIQDMEYDNDGEKIMFELGKGVVSYYESNNLLVRVNGSDGTLPALLLSAHYDSVPSSFGVTDDGMGVASLLGVLRFVAHNQPRRTIIFNFNNNEEFGLFGAHAFVKHPWFKQVGYFLNLEGTGAGGKAVLFRGTDYGIVKNFGGVRYPYATSIFQQGFNNHVIHSETDYKVYKEAGLRGLDLAFYKPRDKYHTGEDNIRNVSPKSLWHMMSNAIDFVQMGVVDDSEEPAVYTTFLGYFFATPISALARVNLVLLVLFPVVSTPLLFVIVKYKKWKLRVTNFLGVPLAMGLAAAVGQVGNPMLVSSHPMMVVATTTSIVVLVYYVVLNGVDWVNTSSDQKLVTMIEVSFVYWVVLVYVTWSGGDHTGEFGVTVLFFVQASTSLLGLIGWTFTRVRGGDEPLLSGEEERYGTEDERDTEKPLVEHNYDWSLQYLLIVPISSLVVYNSGWLVLEGVNKTVQESLASEHLIYWIVVVFSQFLVLPVVPFITKFNRYIVLGLLVVAVVGVLMSMAVHPFNQGSPMKLRFIERIGQNDMVEVYGRQGFVEDVLLDLPLVKQTQAKLKCEALPDGLEVCKYNSGLTPGNLTVEVTTEPRAESYGLISGAITIAAPENRMCTVHFPPDRVKAVVVGKFGNNFKAIPDGFSREKGNYIYKDRNGINQLELYKLDWNKDYHVGFEWLPDIDDEGGMRVEVECFWGDMVPAYQEVVHYSPNWVTWANKERGLVGVVKHVDV